MSTRCEGYRRYGGVFSLGPVTWAQCSEEAVVMITVTQDGETKSFPACFTCWHEALETGIKVSDVRLIVEAKP